jgi:hypothetical protein
LKFINDVSGDLTNLVASESAMCSLSAVDSAIIVYIFDCQYNGASEMRTMEPVCNLAVSGSEMDSLVSQLPAKSAST